MNYRFLILFALCRTVLSFSFPSSLKECQRQLFGSVSLVVATSLPISAHAVEVIKIDADIPALIQIAKDNKDLALKLAQQTAGVVKITDYPKSYSNLLNFVRDVAAGDVFVEINGIPIDVSLLSEKGAIDIDLFTEVGDISVTVSSDILPKLPFLSKRVVPISKTTTDNSNSNSIEEPTKVVRTRAAAAIQAANNAKGSMLDRPFIIDPFQQGWTVKQVLGTTSLGLGLAYASSYAYYVKSLEEEEMAAAEKKKNAAAKNAAGNVDKKKAETKPVIKVEVPVVKVEPPVEVKVDAVSTESSSNTAVPKEETKSTVSTTTGNSKTETSDGIASTEQTKKSRGFIRFWKSED
jgi:hypothetical protein